MSSWANGNVLHCHVADFSLIVSHSVPRWAGNYSAGDTQCLLGNVSYSIKVVFPSWLCKILPSYNDDISCVGTVRERKIQRQTKDVVKGGDLEILANVRDILVYFLLKPN